MTKFTNERTHAKLIDQDGQTERIDLTKDPAPEVAVRAAIEDRGDVQRVVLRSMYDVEEGDPEDVAESGSMLPEDVDEGRKDASGTDVDEDGG